MVDRRPEDAAPTTPVSRSGGEPAGAGRPRRAERDASKEQPSKPSKEGTDAERRRPSGAERFAAVLAAATGGGAARGLKGAARGLKKASGSGPAQATGQGGSTAQGKAPGQGRAPTARRVRRARLRLTHIDPWSVMKTSFLLSVAVGIVTVVAVAVVWAVIGAAGVWDSIDSAIGDVLGQGSEGFTIQNYVGMSRVMGFTMIVAVVDVILITVLATLAAFLYNLAASLLGGIEVVLAEEDH